MNIEKNELKAKAVGFMARHGMYYKDFNVEENCERYAKEMEKGLEKESSFAMIPTYIEMGKKIPLNKKVIVIDAGGTSLRIATVYFDDNENPVIENFKKYKMPGTYGKITADEFYKTIATYLKPVINFSDTIAFCFSFSTETLPNKDAKVILLGKQIEIAGLVGTVLGESLNKVLPSPKKIVVLNDSVATLLGGAGNIISKGLFDYYIGFILGTGSNTCYLEENKNIKKIKNLNDGSMVISMESGNYNGFSLSDIDRTFDSTTRDPGTFTFEKVIGGKYEGGLFLTFLKTAAKESLFSDDFSNAINKINELDSYRVDEFIDNPLEKGFLSSLCKDECDRETLYYLTDLFYERSALLIFINFASIILRSKKGTNPIRPVLIVIEGSTIKILAYSKKSSTNFIKNILNDKLGYYCKLICTDNANMIETTTAALIKKLIKFHFYTEEFFMTNMFKEIMEQPEVLKTCLETNEETLNSVVKEIKKRDPQFIIIAARGTSDHAAVYGKYMFETLTGLPVVLAAPSVVTTYNGRLSTKNALVIGISQSGAAEDVAAIMNGANESDSTTIGITNFSDSLLAKSSKYCLLCSAGVEHSVAATKTFTTQLILLGLLAAKLSGNKKVESDLKNVPTLVKETIDTVQDEIKLAASRYRFIDECIVLARGMNYAVALESALKIEETTYVRAKGFAASDFHHGPMAVLQKDLPIIVYAPTGPSHSDMCEMISLLKQADADILIVSDDNALIKDSNCFIKTPQAPSDFVSPFINAIVAQLFACNLASVKDLNPDAPRMLHKVTVTV